MTCSRLNLLEVSSRVILSFLVPVVCNILAVWGYYVESPSFSFSLCILLTCYIQLFLYTKIMSNNSSFLLLLN
jgi:hypothetical protein